MASAQHSFKLILMGDTSVGKTSLVNRFCYQRFDDRVPMTVGVAGVTTNLKVQGQEVELKIWDTAGQEQYSALIPMFSRGSNVCILVADLVNHSSIEHLSKWKEVLEKTNTEIPIVVGLNKLDLLSDINKGIALTEEVMQSFPKVSLVSAKTGEGVEGMFRMAATMALASETKSADSASIGINSNGSNGSCC